MTQTYGPGMDLMDADYDAPEAPRKGVSAEQQAIVLACDLTDTEKAKVLDTLSDVATGDFYWPLANLADEMGNLYGLAQGSDGLWHDAMVPTDPEDPELGYQFDPDSVK